MTGEQLPLVFTAGQMSDTVTRYVTQLPDGPPCPRCGRDRVVDWLGVAIHTDTIRQTCQRSNP